MITFTDADVAEILAAIISSNRRNRPTQTYAELVSAGMPDPIYFRAYGYANRTGLIKVTGQHTDVTRKGKRYMHSITMAPSPRVSDTDRSAVVNDDLDGLNASRLMRGMADEWITSGPDVDSGDASADSDTSDM